MTARRRTDPAPDPGHALFVERDPARMPIGTLLPRVGAALARHCSRVAAGHHTTPTALGVLGVLTRERGLSHRDLAGLLGVTPATLTPVIDALEKAGDLVRERDRTDRRIVRLDLTDAGAARWVATSAGVAAEVDGFLPRLSAADEDVVRRYLTAVLAAVDGA